MAVNSFTEDSSAEEIIEKLDEYIPYLDEDRQFIRKYRTDFIYHYKNGFYNLALFSFHYLYMFIISTTMVKCCAFNKNEVIDRSGHKHDLNIELFAYFGKDGEKKALKSIPRSLLSNEIILLHSINVSKRDNIAHSNGINITISELINYVNNCFDVLKTIQPIALVQCFQRSEIKEKWNEVNSNILDAIWADNQSSFEELMISFLIDYHLSYKDISHLDSITQDLNAIKFLRSFLDIDSEGYVFTYNEEQDLHHSVYDAFTLKYQPAFSSSDENILSLEEIIIILKSLVTEENVSIVYNVYAKLMDMSQYWVPFGSQKLKEDVNV